MLLFVFLSWRKEVEIEREKGGWGMENVHFLIKKYRPFKKSGCLARKNGTNSVSYKKNSSLGPIF